MRDIYANSWAKTIGYNPTRAREISYSPVREWHRNTPAARARTSHAFLGRRRFDNQDLPPDVILRGTAIYSKTTKLSANGADNGVESRHDTEWHKQHDSTPKRLYTSNGRIRPNTDSRPKTSLGFGSSLKIDTNNSINRVEDLVEVYSFRAEGKALKVKKISKDKKSVIKPTRSPTIVIDPDSDIVPEDHHVTSNNDSFDSREMIIPSIWRSTESKSTEQRSDSRLSVSRAFEKWSQRRSSMRPLLNDTHPTQHSKECPYKCRNCFRACLVSDNVIRLNSRDDTVE